MAHVKRPIDFTDALAELQGLLGREVRVYIGFGGLAGGCSFESRLESAETLPTIDEAVLLHFANGALLDLSPASLRSFEVCNTETGSSWLQLQVRGRVLQIEAVEV